MPNSAEAHQFATEVYAQAPKKHRSKKPSESRSKSDVAKEFVSKKFTLLLDEPDEPTTVSKGKEKALDSSKDRSRRDKKERHTRKREVDGHEWESDEEEKAAKRRKLDEREEEDVSRVNATHDLCLQLR